MTFPLPSRYASPLPFLVALWFLALGYLPMNVAAAESLEQSDSQLEFFENKIRPVLVQNCYGCHSSQAGKAQGGLLLDTREAVRLGGDSGAAVVPHKPEKSLLLSAIRYEDFEMPPKGSLPDDVIADFESWIRLGAADPREGKPVISRDIDLAEGREFWAFQPPKQVSVPEVKDPAWAKHDVDQFILAELEASDLSPADDASAESWLRRVSFDLIGLPPTEQELADFLADDAADARERVVDRLLNSRHFGERWGRHWLDVARFSESTGRTRNFPFPFAWRYRNYVIDSFNADKPMDQFIVEQIAGDQLSSDDLAERENQLVATGFLALGAPDLNERDESIYQMDMVADQIDTMSRSMLGLTVGCARCHDHKFDPIPTVDYYALAGIFKSTQLLNGYAPRGGGGNKARGDLLIKLGQLDPGPIETPSEEEQLIAGLDEEQAQRLLDAFAARDAANARVLRIQRNRQLNQAVRRKQLNLARRDLTQKNRQLNQLRNKLSQNREIKFEGPACLGVRDAAELSDCKIHIGGDTKQLGEFAPRGFLQVATRPKDPNEPYERLIPLGKSGRLELARWIASAENPLTARVFVNRVWRQLFGQGLVRTVDNFGQMGARPTHPELLDYLATRFVASGWSTKQLIQELVLTRTYGMNVVYRADAAAIDENNKLLWRMNARRLDFESMRDAMLLVSGELDRNAPTGSYVETLNVGQLSKRKHAFDYDSSRHRSVYLPVMRNMLPDEMSYFDFPDGSETRGARSVTTVPTQSLFLLNSDFVLDRADATVLLLLQEQDNGDVARRAHQRMLGRMPSEQELEAIEAYVEQRIDDLQERAEQLAKEKPWKKRPDKSESPPRTVAWSEVIQAMFASAEFRYR